MGYLPEVLVLGQKLVLGKPFELHLMLVMWFPLQHQHSWVDL
jgi:hypothetical protein